MKYLSDACFARLGLDAWDSRSDFSSFGIQLNQSSHKVVAQIEHKVAKLTKTWQSHHAEAFHLIFRDKNNNFGERLHTMGMESSSHFATILVHLNIPLRGGELVFPGSPRALLNGATGQTECTSKGIVIKARKGDALIWFTKDFSNALVKSHEHFNCQVTSGSNWVAIKRFHHGKEQTRGKS